MGETGETVFTQRKNNEGWIIPQQKCSGCIERSMSKCFIVAVDHRDAATLWLLSENTSFQALALCRTRRPSHV